MTELAIPDAPAEDTAVVPLSRGVATVATAAPADTSTTTTVTAPAVLAPTVMPPDPAMEPPPLKNLLRGEGALQVQPSAPGGLEAPRLLGKLEGAAPGPTLIVIGGLHGNEPAGVLGLVRLLEDFTERSLALRRGRLVALVGNRRALRHNRRFLRHDLNRHWQPERVTSLQLRAAEEPAALTDEDAELVELAQAIEEARRSTPPGEPVYLLDLHTFSAPGIAFTTLDDNLQNRAFTLRLPVPSVLGLEEELSGTLTSFLSSQGVVSAGYESGQHEDPSAVNRAFAALWVFLESASLLAEDQMAEASFHRDRLALECAHLPPIVEVRYRHHIEPHDLFGMRPGWINFQPVSKHQILAKDRHGGVASPLDGLVLMPLYQKQGDDGFFLVRPVHRRWLLLSAAVRRLPLIHALHWLPGVKRHPELANSYIVDRKFARFLVLEVFHLLGFERRSPLDERFMVWSLRDQEAETPDPA